ncbi:DNA-directed RNA polymerases I II and III subunit RPABC1, partial [Trifolium medium]|nr:DNA-directed RNA polymerases I II and III subunit RPABC1 [Trifolium medium]
EGRNRALIHKKKKEEYSVVSSSKKLRTTTMVFGEEDVAKLYKIRRTILQMLADRNYIVSDTELSMSKQDFKSEFGEHFRREQLEIQKTHKDNPSERVCVFFSDDAKLGVAAVKSIINRMSPENFTRGILVCQKPFSPQAKTTVAAFNNMSTSRLEVFLVICFPIFLSL